MKDADDSVRTGAVEEHNEATGIAGNGSEQTSEVTFATFILSLWSSAMEQLGGGQKDSSAGQDMGLVKNVIDVMVMLREKTAGCLNEDELALLNDLLYELRMKYLLKSK